MRSFTTFIKGHSSKGKTKSEDEKRRIGEKNRVNMTLWMSRHPDVAAKRGTDLNKNRTPEFEARRTASSSATYAAMTPEDKQKFSEHARELW